MRSKLTPLLALLSTFIHAQITVSTAPGSTDQVWFKLQDDASTTRALAEWDLAFEINGGFSAAVLANTAKGLELYHAPYAVGEWSALDTNGLGNGWLQLHNSETDWSVGALGQGLSGEYDLGWGQYNMITHVVVGDSIYVVKLSSGAWKKLRIDALAGGVYSFTFANLDGTAEQTGTVNKADHAGKNFVYWSLESNALIDREPESADWDLLFTRYITNIGMWYGVTGVLQNKGVQVVQVNGQPPAEVDYDFVEPFAPEINTIGYDWKTFDMGTFTYVVDDSLTYFVKDVPGNIWKVVFTAFGGSATGDVSFSKELVSAVGVQENTAGGGQLLVFPNPVTDGRAQFLIDAKATNAALSIIDPSGRVVMKQHLGALSGMSQRTIDVSGLPPGLYSIRSDPAGVLLTTRLVIQ